MSGAAVQLAVQTPVDSVEVSSEDSNTASRPSDAQFSVRLDFFTGPMDLLLHLVARQEVPIEEVSMSLIAEQYLEIVSADTQYGDESELDLEQASEYLVIAATLMAIKSRSLLPTENEQEEELGDWADDNPFFEDLRERLKAYKVTQARAKALRCTPQLGVHTFNRRDRKALQPTPEMLAEPEDVQSLGAMFVALLKRIGDSAGYTIAAQPVSIVTFMVRIVDSLGDKVRDLVGQGKARKTSFIDVLRTLTPSVKPSVKPSAKPSAKPTAKPSTDVESRHRMTVIGGFCCGLRINETGSS